MNVLAGWLALFLVGFVAWVVVQVNHVTIQNLDIYLPVVLGLIAFVMFRLSDAKAAARKAEAMRRAEEDERRSKENTLKKIELETAQGIIRLQLSKLTGDVASDLELFSQIILAANRALDKAESEFEAGAFAPFWDAVEAAINQLVRYDGCVQIFARHMGVFVTTAKFLESQVPVFMPGRGFIPDIAAVIKRMRTIVRMAQKDFHFATIYEQRRTSGVPVADFPNLAKALDEVGGRVALSHKDLANAVAASLAELSQARQVQHEELCLKLEALSSHMEHLLDHLADLEEMPDSIKRRKTLLPVSSGEGWNSVPVKNL